MDINILTYLELLNYLPHKSIIKTFNTNTVDISYKKFKIETHHYEKFGTNYRKQINGLWIDYKYPNSRIPEVILWLNSLNKDYYKSLDLQEIYISKYINYNWDYIKSFNMVLGMLDKEIKLYPNFKILKSKAQFQEFNELILTSDGVVEYRKNSSLLSCFKIKCSDTESVHNMNIIISEKSNNVDILETILHFLNKIVMCDTLPFMAIDNLLQNSKKEWVCVASPEFSSGLIHETIGHFVEGDVFEHQQNSYEYLGRKICNCDVTIIDYANGDLAPHQYFIDEEGSYASDVVIIDKGILTGILSDEDYKKTQYHKVAGVVRSHENNDYPLIRMRNTFMCPGEYSPESILKTVSKGIFLDEYIDGYTDYNGVFSVIAKNAFLIEDGIPTAVIPHLKLSSQTFDFIKSISMVGSDLKSYYNLWCKKENFRVPIAYAAPTIKCKMNISEE